MIETIDLTFPRLLLGWLLLVLLGSGCASPPDSGRTRDELWMTYFQNVPHATQQRVDTFRSTEQPTAIMHGFAGKQVVLSLHGGDGQRLMNKSTHNVPRSGGLAVPLKPLSPGRYVVRASVDGVLKAETYFVVR